MVTILAIIGLLAAFAGWILLAIALTEDKENDFSTHFSSINRQYFTHQDPSEAIKRESVKEDL